MNCEKTPDLLQRGFSLIEMLVVVLLTAIVMIAIYDIFDTNLKIFKVQQEITTMDLRVRSGMEQMVTAVRTGGSNNLNWVKLVGQNPFIKTAESNRIRVVEDLPNDAWRDSGAPGVTTCAGTPADGDTFDRCDEDGNSNYAGDNEDENGDGYINDPYEDVTFSLSGTDLIRTQYADATYCPNGEAICIGCDTLADPTPTVDVIATNIEGLTFEYFINTSTLLTPPVTSDTDLLNIRMVRITLDARTESIDRPGQQPHRIQLKSDVYLRNSN